jgi:AP2 domain
MPKQASQNEPSPLASLPTGAKLRKGNTSGYLGVSWHRPAGKWGAYIRRDGRRQYLGLFDTAEAAHSAYVQADARLSIGTPNPRAILLETARTLYAELGPMALAAASLDKSGVSGGKLRRVGLSHAGLLAELGLTDEFEQWRRSSFTYAGKQKPRWTWERAIEVAAELAEQQGDLPTVQWCRLNGYSQVTNVVHKSGRSWEDLRAAIGLAASVKFYQSRTGVRWRSRPEASLSNFLYARGIEHKRGERYADGYSEQSGRHHGRYDLHFIAADGRWINVEIWGDLPDAYSHGRYEATRRFKEAWHDGDPDFLGIQYQDCLHDARLTDILESSIGVIAPFRFDKPADTVIETAHWSDADEFLETCRQIAAQMPDGIFPGDEWLRKRGRYSDREGEDYNTISQRVTVWMGGTRNVRKLLGQSEASTTAWTRESVIEAWRQYETQHGLSPSQLKSKGRRDSFAPEVVKEAQRIYAVAVRMGARDEARRGVTARVKWTRERALSEWRQFYDEFGVIPTQCMSAARRRQLPRAVTDRATNIYGAVQRLGLLVEVRTLTGDPAT